MDSAPSNSKEKWLRLYARLGLIAHGIVYCLMSILSFMAALGLGNKRADKSEAFKLILEQPFGKIILLVIGSCMLGYVLLRFFQAFNDSRHKGKSMKGLAKRCAYAFIGLTYLSLSFYCFKLVFHQESGSDNQKFFAAKILQLPMGEWIMGGIALGFAIGAIYQIFRGLSKQFMKTVKLQYSKAEKAFTRLGVIGYTARGVVFGIIAYLLMRAALNADPSEAQGTGGAFSFLQKQFGNVLLGSISLGLLAFGMFMFVRAKYEKMNFDLK